MLTRTLGKSGIRVSAVGLGTARIGGLGWQVDDRIVPDEPHSIEADISAIHRALDLGINFVDTDHNYQTGNNEKLVGKVLKGRRDKVILCTKIKPMI